MTFQERFSAAADPMKVISRGANSSDLERANSNPSTRTWCRKVPIVPRILQQAAGIRVGLSHQRATSRSGQVNRHQLPNPDVHGHSRRCGEGCRRHRQHDKVSNALAWDLVIALHVCNPDVRRLTQALCQSRSPAGCLATEPLGGVLALALMRSNACHSARMQIPQLPWHMLPSMPICAIRCIFGDASWVRGESCRPYTSHYPPTFLSSCV